ncbi:MAG TPA: DUF1731 domain-containing protein [Myxococcaceae bacterium]|nr:DUF1731 domain-containing protein [Myxococcaceae bacterium]
MRVLVTGATGLIGSALCDALLSRGDEVVGLTRDPDRARPKNPTVHWYAWQATAERKAEGIVTRVVIFRTGLVISKRGGLLKQLLLPFKLGVGGPIAGGEQFMSWIHIDDEVGLLLWALDNDRVSGIVNATAPNPVTNRELSKALGRALHRPAFMPIPKFAVSALRGGELADAVAGGARVLPRRALDLGYEFRHPELDEALRSALR